MNNMWFTSDQHFSHANVIKYCKRPFSSVEEMNEEMVAKHNSIVGKDDQVYHLGDFSLSKGAVALYLPRLNGRHHLVAGNHDHCHPVHAKSPEKRDRLQAYYKECGFHYIALEGRLTLEIEDVWHTLQLHHMPYLNPDTEGFDDRYKDWRPVDQGNWLLHGHIHERWKVKNKMINVGVDVWDYAPVNLTEIVEIIRNTPKGEVS